MHLTSRYQKYAQIVYQKKYITKYITSKYQKNTYNWQIKSYTIDKKSQKNV